MTEINQRDGTSPATSEGEDHPGLGMPDVPATLPGHLPSGHNQVPYPLWQANYIDDPALDGRGNVFFAAVSMTRMPMIVTDPLQSEDPIVFANGAFLDLTGYSEAEILGRNCRFLQGPRTDPETVQHIRDALATRQPFAAEILNYRRDGTPFWNCLVHRADL